MRKVVFVIGTRAQLVKMAPVLRLAESSGLPHLVWLSGQHEESIDDLVEDFEIGSTIVRRNESIERSTIGLLAVWIPVAVLRCIRFLKRQTQGGKKPIVVVHGDTLSALVGALSGRLMGCRIAHVESGLTSGRLINPFPEELTRRLVLRLSSVGFCPNEQSLEYAQSKSIRLAINTGENTLLDSARIATSLASKDEGAASLSMSSGKTYVVFSIHRFENIFQRSNLIELLEEIAELAKNTRVVFVAHPPTMIRLRKYGLIEELDTQNDVEVVQRMPYTRFIALLSRAALVVTDGGSNQEELSYIGVPTIIWRNESERPDGLGANAIFRREIKENLADFFASGGHLELRAANRLSSEKASPSQIIVSCLQEILNTNSLSRR